MQTVLDHALYYANLGFSVLPLHRPVVEAGVVRCSCGRNACNNIGKHPVARLVPNGLKGASNDPELIRTWFVDDRNNIGIVTGGISGFFALDVDPRHDGDETLRQLELSYGPLPNTVHFLTGGGGEHILFAYPGYRVPNSAGKIGKGLDIRGDGGYIVAPPSFHASGRPYAISVDQHPDDVPLAEAPRWLLEELMGKKSYQQQQQGWRDMAMNAVPEGQRNVAIAKLSGLLLAKRIDPCVTFDLMLGYNKTHCVPPLDDKEVAQVVASITRKEMSRRAQKRIRADAHG